MTDLVQSMRPGMSSNMFHLSTGISNKTQMGLKHKVNFECVCAVSSIEELSGIWQQDDTHTNSRVHEIYI